MTFYTGLSFNKMVFARLLVSSYYTVRHDPKIYNTLLKRWFTVPVSAYRGFKIWAWACQCWAWACQWSTPLSKTFFL